MTTTDNHPAHRRPAPDCPSWCTDLDDLDDLAGTRMHATVCTPLRGHTDGPGKGGPGRSLGAMSGTATPRYSVIIHRVELCTGDEMRATADALLAFVDRIDGEARSEALIREGLTPLLRERNAVRGLPDDDPRRQAALQDKERLLTVLEDVGYESA